MGFLGLLWLSETIDKLEALKAMVKTEEEKKAIDEIIADLKAKKEEK